VITAQQTGNVLNPEFDQKISESIQFTIPIIGVEEFKKIQDDVYIFDARENEEYELSHIPGAIYVGYDQFDLRKLADLDKEKTIVVYCSIGYRSEKVGEKLLSDGFENVYNLYGSIFEWANQGNDLRNSQGEKTNIVHTYNKAWSKWLDNPDYKKTW
jgi:rhodanese-related sulfurtransferase